MPEFEKNPYQSPNVTNQAHIRKETRVRDFTYLIEREKAGDIMRENQKGRGPTIFTTTTTT